MSHENQRFHRSLRSFLHSQDINIQEEVYGPLDEGGMDFISLQSLSKEGFSVFYDATRRAYDNELSESPDSHFKSSWNELLSSLLSDSRCSRQ